MERGKGKGEMPTFISSITVGQIVRHLATSGSTILAILGFLWFVAKPHAQDFVTETVQAEKFASQQSLDQIDDRTKALEQAIAKVQSQQNDQALQTGIISSDVGTIKQLQKETLRVLLSQPN